jgi:MFS family permease
MREFFQKGHFHYGWYIVGSAFVILFFNAGAQYASGVMFKPIIKEFGWSRASISLIFFVNMVVFALGLIIVGRLYDRFGPKWTVILSTVLLSAGLVWTAFIHSLGQFFLSFGILAALGLAGTALPLLATVTSTWFEKRRGLAISLATAGTSAGQFVLVPLLTRCSLTYGWRTSYLFAGITIFIVNVLLVFLVVRGDPRHLGLQPYGAGEAVGQGRGRADQTSLFGGIPSLGVRKVFATRSFWLFSVTMFICGGGDFFSTTHLIPLVTDYGISPLTAGDMLAFYGLMALAGVLIAGPAADRVGNKAVIVLTFSLRLCLYLFVIQYKTVTSLYAFALLFGLTHLVTAPLTPMLMGKLYGGAHLGLLTGCINTVHFLGAGFWTYMAGMIFDRTGSYQFAFVLMAVMAATAVLSSLFILEKRYS